MSSDEKLLAGPAVDYACEVTEAGIRVQRPVLSEEAVGQLLIERLALRRQLDRAGHKVELTSAALKAEDIVLAIRLAWSRLDGQADDRLLCRFGQVDTDARRSLPSADILFDGRGADLHG